MAREGNRRAVEDYIKTVIRAAGAADQDVVGGIATAFVILRGCEEMPQIARKGALNNLSPALGACAERGETGRGGFCGRGGGHHKCLGCVRLCSGRLRGRG